MYLTRVGKASSLQKDKETKRTPAGVAGGRLVISCSSCSASSSVGLENCHNEEMNLKTWYFKSYCLYCCFCIKQRHKHIFYQIMITQIHEVPGEILYYIVMGITWDRRCPLGHSRVGAERWPSPHAPLWGQSTLSCPPPCHHHWARECCESAAGWRPAPAAAVCASATAPSCFLSFAGRTEKKRGKDMGRLVCFHPLMAVQFYLQ